MTSPADVTLVVPTYRRQASLARLLDAVEALDPAPGAVLVVAGDAGSAQAAATRGTSVLPVTNRNAAASRNAGWRAATTSHVAFLDDDCEPAPEWVAAVVAALSTPTRHGQLPAAVGGAVTNPRPRSRVARASQGWLDRRYPDGEAEWLASQNLALPRAWLERVGGFDDELTTYEDVDLSLRLRDAGGALVRVPGMRVTHHHREDLPSFVRQHHGYGQGFVRLARKRPTWDQARRAPLGLPGLLRTLGLAVARPFLCAVRAPGGLVDLPLYLVREAAFTLGAVREARR